jgi:hypothetical protein
MRKNHGGSHASAPEPSLSGILEYRNDDVVYRFRKLYDVTWAEAEDLFTETKKWLWLCGLPDAPRLPILSSMHILDEMWHNFVLFTQDYQSFCDTYFGRFMHHNPTRESRDQAPSTDVETHRRTRERELQAALRFTYDRLGEQTLWKWHVYHPMRYPPAFFQESVKVPRFSVPEGRMAAKAALVPQPVARARRTVSAALTRAGYSHVRHVFNPDEFRWVGLLVGDVVREEDVGPAAARAADSRDTDTPPGARFAAYLHVGQGTRTVMLRAAGPRRPAAARVTRPSPVTLQPGESLYVDCQRIRHDLAPLGAEEGPLKRLWIGHPRRA